LPWKEREEHEQQIVSDSMYNHNDHYFCILRSIVLTIQKVCSLNFLHVTSVALW